MAIPPTCRYFYYYKQRIAEFLHTFVAFADANLSLGTLFLFCAILGGKQKILNMTARRDIACG